MCVHRSLLGFPSHSGHHRALSGSLCCRVGLCQLSVLYMVVCTCQQFEHTLGDSEGQGSLVCCSPRGHKESDTTLQLNNKNNSMSTVDILAEMVFSWGGRLSSGLQDGGSTLSLCGKPKNVPRHCPVSPGGRKQNHSCLRTQTHIYTLYMYIADIYVCINVSIHVSTVLPTQIHVYQIYNMYICMHVCSVDTLAYCVSWAQYCEEP